MQKNFVVQMAFRIRLQLLLPLAFGRKLEKNLYVWFRTGKRSLDVTSSMILCAVMASVCLSLYHVGWGFETIMLLLLLRRQRYVSQFELTCFLARSYSSKSCGSRCLGRDRRTRCGGSRAEAVSVVDDAAAVPYKMTGVVPEQPRPNTCSSECPSGNELV